MVAIFLLSITCVCASEIDDTIASEDTNTAELSVDNDIIGGNLQTSEKDDELTLTGDNETLSTINDAEVLGDNPGTYSMLSSEIGSGGKIELQHDYYTYDAGDTISISVVDSVIDGKGAVIDMAGSNIRAFNVTASGVTIKNLTIKNANCKGNGGAIYFNSSGTVTNCNFTDNTATGDGGAVYFYRTGAVSNCNFTNNTGYYGGAVRMSSGTVTNCNFTDNSAGKGGAIHMGDGTVSNCNFTDNSATVIGGAISMFSGNVTNCNFVNNSATFGGAINIDSGTVSNCNFINNKASTDSGGGAVYFNGEGTVTNCNFTGNTATGDGGAVFFLHHGTVTNCSFTGNTATGDGGAIYYSYFRGQCTVTNCSFIGNTATGDGGAVYFVNNGAVSNCNFADNSASRAGAIYSVKWYTTADTCIFKRNSGDNVNTVIYPPTLNVNNFTTVYGSGEKLTFDLKTNSSIPVTNGNISISVYFKDNGEWVRNYTCLSGEGWIPDLPVGSYIAFFDTEYAKFQKINRTVTITMPNVRYSINVSSVTTNNKTVNITAKTDIPKNILWEGKLLFILPNGTQIEATYGANGTWWAEHTFDAYGEYKVNATYVGLDNVTINNGTITINKVNSTITLDNIVLDYGETKNVTVTTTGATGITVKIGESEAKVDGFVISIHLLDAGNYTLTVTTITDDDHNPVTKEVNITVNKVNSTLTVNDIVFDYGSSGSTVVSLTGADGVNATVVGQPKNVVKVNGTNITVFGLDVGTYTLTVTTIADKNHNNITKNATITVNKVNTILTVNDIVLDYGSSGNVTVIVEGATGIVAKIDGSEAKVDGFIISIPALDTGTYTLTVTAIADKNHNNITKNATITVNKVNTILTVNDIVLDYGSSGNVTVIVEGATGIVAKIDGSEAKVDGFIISIPALDTGTYTLTVTAIADKNHNNITKNATIIVNKLKTELTGNAITTTYNVNKDLVITLKDSTGKALSGVKVTVDLNGAKTYTTDKNGQVKVSTKGIAPKAYTAKVTFNGDTNYGKSTKDIKVTVKKATPKLTAKKKTYKTTPKTKKYTIVLKDNTGKAIKKAKVTLKVKGKTYKATTNSKGKATFKITKLNKKGTYKATITYKGNKYYNKISKKAKIKVIVTFKTVSKGSKDKATVKEIQQALKNKGYYLTYQGHYLKVDGKFNSCTFRSVKEFQKDKCLKVTGKVDEKTAKKLGIL